MSGAAGRYVVEVDEIGIFATGIGIGWWTENVLKRPIADPITWLALTPCGGVAQIPCADREEARFVRGRMVGHGIHRSHAKSGAFAACHLCIAGSRGAQARPDRDGGRSNGQEQGHRRPPACSAHLGLRHALSPRASGRGGEAPAGPRALRTRPGQRRRQAMHANKSEPLIIGTDPETGQELTLWDKKGGRVIGAGQGMAALWDELTERVAARPDAVLLQASPDGQARRTLQHVWDTIVARSRSRRRTRMHQPTRGQPLIVLAIGEAEAVAALDDNLGALLNGIASKCRSEGVSLVLGRGEAQVTSWEQVPR